MPFEKPYIYIYITHSFGPDYYVFPTTTLQKGRFVRVKVTCSHLLGFAVGAWGFRSWVEGLVVEGLGSRV